MQVACRVQLDSKLCDYLAHPADLLEVACER